MAEQTTDEQLTGAMEDIARLGLEVHELTEERDAARAEVERLRAELAHAREQAAADVETHGQELMDAAIKQVTKDDPDGFSAVLRAAAIGSAAKYLRGEAGS